MMPQDLDTVGLTIFKPSPLQTLYVLCIVKTNERYPSHARTVTS